MTAVEIAAPPSETPLLEEVLAAHPAAREYFAMREQLDALAAPPDVTVKSGIRAAFDHELDNLASGWSPDHALVIGHYVPEPDDEREPEVVEGVIVPDEPGRAQAQSESLDALKRWGADTGSFSAVRDPEPEVHHEDTVTLRVVREDES